jgi:ATP-dependent RNA helicase DeaD
VSINFLELGVNENLITILKQSGITTPTPVQAKTIPLLIKKNDVIAQAQTGTGKTLAFLLPIIQNIHPEKASLQALIITPTRELAMQITKEAKKLAPYKNLNILSAYGGQDVERQINKLKGCIHIVIGTPGRLLDLIKRKSIDFSSLKMLVLDEADQIMDMGFFPDVENIIKTAPKKRQTMLFSATITKGVRMLSTKFMNKPDSVVINTRHVTLDEIKQKVIHTTEKAKQETLIKIITEENPFMAIIFCKTKKRATTLNYALGMLGYNCNELHGDMQQSKREKVLKSFRELKTQFLIATDIAARGLDIEGITHIINYDVPEDTESYIHRIGRTGRAGQSGVAITIATAADKAALNIIEAGIKVKFEKRK